MKVLSHPKGVRKLYAPCTNFDKILKRSVSLFMIWIAHEILVSAPSLAGMMLLSMLSVSWPSYHLLQLTHHGKPAPPPSPWSRRDTSVLLPWPPPWPDWDASWGELSLGRVEFLSPRRNWWGHHQFSVIFSCLSLFFSCFFMWVFNTTSVIP